MDVSEAIHATTNRVSSVFTEACKALLDVLKQTHRTVPGWRRSQGAGEQHRDDAKTCGHEQRAARMLPYVFLGLGGGFGTSGKDGINDGMGISGNVGKGGNIHELS